MQRSNPFFNGSVNLCEIVLKCLGTSLEVVLRLPSVLGLGVALPLDLEQ